MAVSPNSVITTQSIRTTNAVTVAAKTTYADNVNAVKLADAGTNGSILYSLKATPRATVTATQLQLYTSPDAGATMFLVSTALMTAYTMAQTTQAPSTDLGYSETAPLRIPAGSSLWVGAGVAVAGGISWFAQLEDL